MDMVIERPPVAGEPPELPPFLRKRGPPRRGTIIVPDLMKLEYATHLRSPDNNWITIIYQFMNRIHGESILDPEAKWEFAHTSMRRYRQWLETYETETGVPPHIQFGGAIEVRASDPTFYPRWIEYAKEMFT